MTNISGHGLWLLLEGVEHFLPFEQFPWFKNASIAQVVNVQQLSPRHLYWPDLDIDLAVDSIIHPDRYPLVSRAPSN